MRLLIVCFALLAAVSAFGHAGEVHTYMGTVAAVHDSAAFTMKKTDGGSLRVEVSAATAYVHANGTRGTRDDVTPGKRVVVTISKDGRTASLVKIAASKR
ncbi:MAG TPA: hypothetical protein VNI54_04095 [Thermoanaerobaculia bacterium]|nr:hypothetical protein [Thermoanaerobaculia bacterium]